MQILVACEESQAVTIALRKLGHEAYSCDLIPCSGGHPEWHIQQDVLPLLNGYCFFKTCDGSAHYVLGRWDMLIAFPPCTYLTNASAVRMRVKGEIVAERYAKAMEAKAFFMSFLSADCAKIAVENPTPLKIVELPPYTQAIQPWQFGHPYTKRTCLWLKELPLLVPTEIITEGVTPWVNGGCKDAHGNYRRFQGRRERDPHQQGQNFPRHSRRNGGTMGRARNYLTISPPRYLRRRGEGGYMQFKREKWELRQMQAMPLRLKIQMTAQRIESWYEYWDSYNIRWEAPFKISEQCCDVMKKEPMRRYQKETRRMPIVGTMCTESQSREKSWLMNGCNAFEAKYPQSRPMSFWTENDVLMYLFLYDVPYASVYGDIRCRFKGEECTPEDARRMLLSDRPADDYAWENNFEFYTTGVSRTGCMFCAFGAHLESCPNRFQQMEVSHPKQYDYCMRPVDQGGLGMAEVLDYIGVDH